MTNSIHSTSAEGIKLIKKWETAVKKRDFYFKFELYPQMKALTLIRSDEIDAYYINNYIPYHNKFQEINIELEEATKNLPFDFNPNL